MFGLPWAVTLSSQTLLGKPHSCLSSKPWPESVGIALSIGFLLSLLSHL